MSRSASDKPVLPAPSTGSFIDFKPHGRHRTVRRMLDPQPTDEILDVGCSSGYFLRHYLEGRVKRVAGTDLDPAAIAFASEHSPSLELIACDATEQLPFAPGSFDKVVCSDVVEHVSDERKLLQNINTVLRPGGLLVVSVPNDFANRLDGNWPEHRHYSLRQLTKIMEQSGFMVERAHRGSLLPHVVHQALRFGRTPALLSFVRKVVGPLEDLDHAANLRFGFTLSVAARKRTA